MMKTIEGYTYKVGQHIGKGYSSTVHRGIHDATGEPVSIKVIQMSKLEDPVNHMLLQLEVAALKSLSYSKHVLHLINVYATRNNTYIITELCDGDLSKIIKERKTIPYAQAVDILKQLVSGYLDLHRSGYIHRDIKPANIFHKSGVYKIGDFGFTIPISDLQQHRTYNVGSPVYMPPEALKQNLYSISCDTWALGVMFYQMINGVVPWRSISEKVLHEKIISEPISNFTANLPEVARTFLAQILCLNPTQRITPAQLAQWPDRLASFDIKTPLSINPPLKQSKNNSLSMKSAQNILVNFNRETNLETDHKVMLRSDKITFTQKGEHRENAEVYDSFNKENRVYTPKQPKEMYQPLCYTGNDKEWQAKQQSYEQQQIHKQNKLPYFHSPVVADYKQAEMFFSHYNSYIHFLHRVIKFIAYPSKLALPDLEASLAQHLFKKMDQLKDWIDEKADPKVERWGEYVKSDKGISASKSLLKSIAKYRMFHSVGDRLIGLSGSKIQEGVTSLMEYLKEKSFDAKMVIGADYLTTCYQLLQLEEKYSVHEFLKMSKIDLIMQGCPYFATEEHLIKLRNKLALINI